MSMSIFAPAAAAEPSALSSPGSPYLVRTDRKSAGKSWLLSLLIPGLGQMLLGAKYRGRVTMLFFFASILFAIYVPGDWRWFGVRLALMIHAFAGLDAYFTAREYNRGMDVEADANPRVAAVLNLTTSGFGYVYLGIQSALGVVIAINFARRMLGDKIPLLLEIFAAGIAIHGWLMASKQRAEVYPADKRPPVFETSVHLSLPIIAAALVILPYYALVTIGQLMLWLQ
jgi:TM2 domain-containing membrane protein YozV